MTKVNRETKAHTARRPARKPLSSGSKLAVDKSLIEEGYHYFWSIDKVGEIERMEAAWYEKVTDARGDNVTVSAGNGLTHYLMRIEQKYYDEDFNEQQSRNTEVSNKTAQEVGNNEYVPMGRKSVVEREII